MSSEPGDAHFEEQARKHFPYNFSVLMVQGSLAWFGLYCTYPRTVLATYLSKLTDSKLLISLPEHIYNASWTISMLFFAYVIQKHRTRKWPATFYGLGVRLPMLIWGLAALGSTRYGPTFGIVGVYVGLLVQVMAAGPSELSWSDMISRVIPPERRGLCFASWRSVGYIFALAAPLMTARMIGDADNVSSGDFALPFLVGGTAFLLSGVCFAITREPEHPEPPPRHTGYWAYLRKAMEILKSDRPFRRFVWVRLTVGLTSLFGTSLFTAYALQDFGISEQTTTGRFTMVMILSQLISIPLLGLWADQSGFKAVYVLSLSCVTASSILGLTLPLWAQPVHGLDLCYALSGIGVAGMFMAVFNITFEFAGVHSRTIYIAVASTLSAPASLIAGTVGSAMADIVGTVPVLAASAVINILVTGIVIRFLPDPRKLARNRPGPATDPA